MEHIEIEPAVSPLRRSPLPARILGMLGTFAVFALLFLKLGSEVGEGELRTIDRGILLALRMPGQLQTPRGPAWLRESVTDLSSLGSPTVLWLVVLLGCGYLLTRQRLYHAAVVLGVIGSGCLAVSLCKIWFGRARPDVVPHLVPAYTLSFPSGHAADSAIVYLTLAMLVASVERRWATRTFLVVAAAAITLTIGFTRLYLGVHWPSDVLAGWILGSGWALVGHLATRKYSPDR